eukprot:1972054-Lingulodinium_polyedra.AAC.1
MRIQELEEIIRDKEIHFLRASKSHEMLEVGKKRMECQKNELIEGQKKALVDRETVQNQLAQVTTAYNAT